MGATTRTLSPPILEVWEILDLPSIKVANHDINDPPAPATEIEEWLPDIWNEDSVQEPGEKE